MKFLKILLGIIVVLILGYVLYCAMSPKTMSVERSMTMNATPDVIFEEIADFDNWKNWSPWAKIDSNMVTTVEGAGMGSIMSWTSDHEEVGNGSQEIIELDENKMMRTKLKFGEMDNFSGFYLKEGDGGTTEVTWTMEEYDMPFMFRGMAKMMDFKSMLNGMYDQGLGSLKAVAEAKPKTFIPPPFKVMERESPEMNYIAKNVKCNTSELEDGSIHQEAFGQIGAAMGANELGFGGAPICIMNSYDEATGDMDADFAIPVNGVPTSVDEGLRIGVMPAGKVVYAIHYGSYDTLDKTWGKIVEYVESSGLEVAGPPYEVYINDPMSVTEAELKTEIVYPVK